MSSSARGSGSTMDPTSHQLCAQNGFLFESEGSVLGLALNRTLHCQWHPEWALGDAPYGLFGPWATPNASKFIRVRTALA